MHSPSAVARVWFWNSRAGSIEAGARRGSAIVSGGWCSTRRQLYRRTCQQLSNSRAGSMPPWKQAKTATPWTTLPQREPRTIEPHQGGAAASPTWGARQPPRKREGGGQDGPAPHTIKYGHVFLACGAARGTLSGPPRRSRRPPPISTMTERRISPDRRSGQDRRSLEKGPPASYERRRSVEARQPELTELHLNDEELQALGFVKARPPHRKPG